jgi:glycosyltransferase involved in cell wall biosynthesis
MPVYKGDKYLQEAVDSILTQTFKDFEFIIICDDPTDETRRFLDQRQQSDNRIKVYYQERQGLVQSLNKGISISRGEYLARMDADDISLPHRLEKQVEFMDNNPEIGISGTWIKTLEFDKLLKLNWKLPCEHETMKSKMLFEPVVAHPSVIIRKNIFCKNDLCYNQDETYAEDYGLWVRAAKLLRFANLPEFLLYFRMHESTTNKSVSQEVANKIRLSQISQLGITPTKAEFEIHEDLSYYKFGANEDFRFSAKAWLEKLQDANLKMKIYPEPAFSNVLASYWYIVCFTPINLGLDSWHQFHNSKLSKSANLSDIPIKMLLLRPTVRYLKNRISFKFN